MKELLEGLSSQQLLMLQRPDPVLHAQVGFVEVYAFLHVGAMLLQLSSVIVKFSLIRVVVQYEKLHWHAQSSLFVPVFFFPPRSQFPPPQGVPCKHEAKGGV